MTRAGGPAPVTEIDLRDIDRWQADGPPFEWFRAKREQGPVHHHPGVDGSPGFWVVLDHEQVTALGRCPHALSSDHDNGGVAGLGAGDELQAELDSGFASLAAAADGEAKMLLTMDPPEHTANRKLLNRGFTPAAIGNIEPSVRELATSLLDRLADGEVVDFTTQVAMPLPMQVIGDLVGADRSTHADLLRWSNEAAAGTDPEYHPAGGTQMESALSLASFFFELREARGDHPGDDLTGKLITASIDGQPLSEIRFGAYMFLLAAAGNETTRNAISHSVWAFADHPDQWQRLREDRSLLPLAVEEVLRWASPLLYFRRNAVREMQIGDVAIEPGELVSLWYVSANRDETVFEEPDNFDIGRDPNPHVAFGGGGPHFCLGASLARLEVRVLLEEMLDRYDGIERRGEPERLRSNFLNGVKHLPVRLHASR